MQIRRSQMKEMARFRGAGLAESVMRRLKLRHPLRTVGDDGELRRWAGDAIAKGRQLNVHGHRNLHALADFFFVNGIQCLESAEFGWAREILTHPQRSETARMNQLSEFQVFNGAASARAAAAGAGWAP